MKITDLETPCLLIDKRKIKKNIEILHSHLKKLHVSIRPHGKTAKNIDVIRMAMDEEPQKITVSTLKEAEYYFSNGIKDILYAVGIAPVKLNRVRDLFLRGASVTLILDSVELVKIISDYAMKENMEIPVLIELDCDGHRAGVRPDSDLLFEIAKEIKAKKGIHLGGVMTHAGASYSCSNIECIRRIARQERDCALRAAENLRHEGYECKIVSVGSTPTATFTDNYNGITEVRAGVYMFQDLVMAGLGVCGVSDIAISVLTSIIGHQKEKGWVITDAGWMALSRDRGTASQSVDQGYGLVCKVDGEILENFIVSATNQEHGIITVRGNTMINFENFPIGSVLRILPNHACATAAMHDRYFVVDGSDEVIDIWKRISGW